MLKAKRLAALIFIAVMLAQTAMALNYTIYNHTISIQINPEGTDTVVEKYFISFPTDLAKKDFREKSLAIGTSIDDWKKLNASFSPSLGESTTNKKIAYNEGAQSYLQISYDLAESLMAKDREATMITEYSIKANYFNSFYQSGLWIIPEATTISIELPPGAELRETIEPQANITSNGARKVVVWQGYKSGNNLTLKYILWKKLDTVIDLNALTAYIFKTQEGAAIALVFAALVCILLWQRKTLVEKVEEFVEKNSEITEE